MINNKIRQNISCLMLLLFIIGYFFHEFFYALGLINRLPFGIIGFINIAFMISYSIFFIKDYKAPFLSSKYSLLITIFFLFSILWSFINKVTISQEFSNLAFTQMLTTIIVLFTLYVATFYNDLIKTKKYLMIFSIFVFIYFLYFSISRQTLFINIKTLSSSDSDDLATYQGLARSVSLASVFVLPVIRKNWFFWSFSFISLFSVFMLGSRSELVFLLVFISIVILINLIKGDVRSKISILLVFVLSFVLFFVFRFSLNNVENRNLQLLDIEQSSSYQGRSYFNEIALRQIYESPILGDFGGHVYVTGSVGSYSHNVFSTWVNLGVVGFLLYLMLILIPIYRALIEIIVKKTYNENLIFIISFGLASLVLIIFAKPFFWPVPAILWGSYSSYLFRYGKNQYESGSLNVSTSKI